MRERLTIAVVMTSSIILFVLIVLGLIGALNNYTCHRFSKFTNLQVRTGWPSSCYVKTSGGQWILRENYIIYGEKS